MKRQASYARFLLICAVSAALPLNAQDVSSGKPQSAVENGYGLLLGSVVVDSSQLPARGAIVSVQSLASAGKLRQALVDPSGLFSFPRLEAGRYKVSVLLTGYLLQVESQQAMVDATAGGRTREVDISVDRGGSQSLNLRLIHAASISGTALWEDGVPVIGATIEVETSESSPRKGNFPRIGRSDDLGHFRVSGLEPGRYRVAVLPRLSTFSDLAEFASRPDYDQVPAKLRIYAKAAFDAKAAEVFTLDAGNDLSNVEVTVPLNSLHSVRGRIEFLKKTQGVSFLSISRLPGVKVGLFAPVRADGTFDLELVPPGTYRLRIYGPNKEVTSQGAHAEHANEEEDLALVYEGTLEVSDDVVDLIVQVP